MRVIPALVQGAEMPSPDALPEPLKPLTRRHGSGTERLELAQRRTSTCWAVWRAQPVMIDSESDTSYRSKPQAGAEPPERRRSPFRRWFEGRGQRKADEDEVSGVGQEH